MRTSLATLSRRQLGGLLVTSAGWLRLATGTAAVASTDERRRQLTLPPLEVGYKRLWLVRHGETEWNVENRVQGRTDNALNANGRAQASALARYLADDTFDVIADSSLARAAATADAVAERHPSAVREHDPRFMEMGFGDFEGAKLDEFQSTYQAMLARWENGETSAAWPRGESVDDVAARGVDGLRSLLAGPGPRRNVLVVAHGRFNKILISELTTERKKCNQVAQGNTCINVLDVPDEGGKARLQALDVSEHLALAVEADSV